MTDRTGTLVRCFSLASVLTAVTVLITPTAAGASTFSNPTPITAPATSGMGTPYPSVIDVSGLPGPVAKARATLRGLQHDEAHEFDILLVGPGGQNALLMSDACGGLNLNASTFIFDDAAPAPLSSTDACPGGQTYKPTDHAIGGPDTFVAPAPAGPYPAALSVFDGVQANGRWSLFVTDDDPAPSDPPGSLASGWSLDLDVTPVKCGGKQATIGGTDGDDSLTGTSGADVIVGLDGKDKISGLQGKDVACGGSGNDTLSGGTGKDKLLGQQGRDRLKGGNGRDTCKGGKGNDSASACEVERSI